MSPQILRLIGLLCVVAAIVLSILNLKRVADAGTFWVVPPLLIIGLAIVALSRRR
jgi:uncharacterized membrane protein